MKNFLALIRRADFIDLYKFGCFYLNRDVIVEFDCSIKELSQRDDIYDALFARVNSFESSFAYLIINFTKSSETDDYSFISIQEVKHIFPLDFEAKREFEVSFDDHIRIDNPIWLDAISLVKKKQMFISSMQGVRNIFNIFKLEGIEECKAIISDDTVEEMLSAVYEDIRPAGEIPLWVYLMRYERHSYYPKESLGYFMDIVHIIVNFMSKQEVEDYVVESTDIYKVLESYQGKQYKSNDIIHLLKQNEKASGFLLKIASFIPEIDFILVAVNYLKLRDLYKEEFVYNEKFISACKDAFGKCFTLAAYMVGIALSHDKTYTCLYETLPLEIYKSKEEMAAIMLRKREERERAKREMERIERERARELEQRHRKNEKKRGGKKGQEYSPFGQSGYSQGRGGYPTWERQSGESFPPYQGDNIGHTPYSTVEKKLPKSQPTELPINKPYKDAPKTGELFEQEEQKKNRLLSFPLTLKKYTAKGKPSTAKNSIKVIKTKEEYHAFLEAHPNETWKPYLMNS